MSRPGGPPISSRLSCAGPDSDGDGAVDDSDNCPTVADVVQTDSDGDGLTDYVDPDPDCADEPWASEDVVCVLGASPTEVDLASGTSGSLTDPPHVFNETRGLDVTVGTNCGDLAVDSMTPDGLPITDPTATVGARIYDPMLDTLVASADTTVTSGTDLSVTVPVSATLLAGPSYRVAFFVDTGGDGGSATMLHPDATPVGAFPYTESTGVLEVNWPCTREVGGARTVPLVARRSVNRPDSQGLSAEANRRTT